MVRKSVASRKVTVMERVLKDFSIDFIYLVFVVVQQPGLPLFTKLNLWLVIKFSSSSSDPVGPRRRYPTAPVVFQSTAFTNIDSSYHSTVHFAVPAGQR